MQNLTAVREDLERIVRDIDVDALDGSGALQLVEDAAAIVRLGDALKTLGAGRLAETRAWARDGDRSVTQFLARTTGTGFGEAEAVLDTAARIAELPATADALRAGKLSRVQVNEIAAAATVDPEAERQLLRTAERDTVKGLKERCARVKAAARTDEVDHYNRMRAARSLRTWADGDGAHLHLQSTPDAIATVLAGIKPYERQIFDAARQRGEHERASAYAADALVAMAQDSMAAPTTTTGGKRRPARAEIRINVDLPAFERGELHAGETCEIPGIGPVPVAVARSVASDAVIDVIVTQGRDIRSVVSLGRTIPHALRVALEHKYPTCAQPGCDARDHLEIDHLVPFASPHNGPTRLDNLVRWCPHHHHLKTNKGYLPIRGPDGEWQLIPPGPDPPGDPPPHEPPPAAASRCNRARRIAERTEALVLAA